MEILWPTFPKLYLVLKRLNLHLVNTEILKQRSIFTYFLLLLLLLLLLPQSMVYVIKPVPTSNTHSTPTKVFLCIGFLLVYTVVSISVFFHLPF
jgi:hypothetical protein